MEEFKIKNPFSKKKITKVGDSIKKGANNITKSPESVVGTIVDPTGVLGIGNGGAMGFFGVKGGLLGSLGIKNPLSNLGLNKNIEQLSTFSSACLCLILVLGLLFGLIKVMS
jgi:hypothetical protein